MADYDFYTLFDSLEFQDFAGHMYKYERELLLNLLREGQIWESMEDMF